MYSCQDNIVLFIGNPREGDLANPLPTTFLGQVCDFDHIWFLDLLNEYCLRGFWIPTSGASRPSQENIIENINVGLIGSPQFVVDMRAKLDDLMQQANKWHRGEKRNNSIWLYNQFTGEENIRRSLIYNLLSRDVSVQYPQPNGNPAIDMQLSIERHYCWEDYYYQYYQPANNFLYWGTIQNTGFGTGTENARIQLMQLKDLIRNPATRRIIGNLWLGIKEDYGCGLDHWSPLWECESAFAVTAYANVNVADATASGGFYRNVNFPAIGTAMTTQITLTLNTAFSALTRAQYEEFRGDYIVLIRAKLEDPNMVVPMTIRYGWYDGGRKNVVRQSPVIFTGESDWRLIEIGVVSIPPDSGKQALSLTPLTQNNLGNFSINVIAGLDASGALGDLYLDALYLIPYEHRATLRYQGRFAPRFASQPVISDALWIATHENDLREARYLVGDAMIGDSVDPTSDYIINDNDWSLPYTNSRMVFAVNSFDEVGGVYKNVNDLTWRTLDTLHIYPRWLSYRTD